MTVWVDDMKAKYKPPHRPGVTYVMSHMISDDPEELHDMARRIGVARRWFQGDHYDVTQSARAQAVKYGAVEITWRMCSTMTMNVRCGLPMGTPETATKIAEGRRGWLPKEKA